MSENYAYHEGGEPMNYDILVSTIKLLEKLDLLEEAYSETIKNALDISPILPYAGILNRELKKYSETFSGRLTFAGLSYATEFKFALYSLEHSKATFKITLTADLERGHRQSAQKIKFLQSTYDLVLHTHEVGSISRSAYRDISRMQYKISVADDILRDSILQMVVDWRKSQNLSNDSN